MGSPHHSEWEGWDADKTDSTVCLSRALDYILPTFCEVHTHTHIHTHTHTHTHTPRTMYHVTHVNREQIMSAYWRHTSKSSLKEFKSDKI